MKAEITGSTLPVLQIALEPGDKVVAEPGEFSWMTQTVQLNTTTQTAGAKGVLGVLGRALAGGGIFMTEYSVQGGPGLVAFAAKIPGHIVPVEVQAGRGYMVHRRGFLCATEGVQLVMGFQRSLGAGVFGGDGFVMQRLSGSCQAWVELGGEIVTYELAAGEVLQAHPGHVGMFEESVNFDVTFLRGIKNVFFGGDGLFVARLTGPGKVWLQSLTLPNLAHALGPYFGKEQRTAAAQGGVAGGIAGAMLRDVFNT
ncbi:MAG: AIM24 family protein, partial [Vulcanimicrobiaceae bacterium]